MQCKQCGTEITKGKFCPKCGFKNEEETTVEIAVSCPNCQKELKADSKFCTGCGTRIEKTSAKSFVAATVERSNKATKDFLNKSKPFIEQLNKKYIGAGIAVILVVILVIALIGGDRSSKYGLSMMYVNDQDSVYLDWNGSEFKKVMSEMGVLKADVSFQKFAYLQDEKLYIQQRDDDKELIAKEVTGFAVDEKIETVLYTKDTYYGAGRLIYQKLGKDEVVLSKEAAPKAHMSINGKYVLYCEPEENEAYLSELGKEGTKVADDVQEVLRVSNKGEALIVNTDNELILVKKDGKKEVIVEGVINLSVDADFNQIYVLDEEQVMSIYEKGKVTTLQEDVTYMEEVAIDSNTQYIGYMQDDEYNIILKNQQVVNLGELVGSYYYYQDPVFTPDGQTAYYKDADDNLKVKTFNNKGVAYEETIAKDVSSFEMSPCGKYVTYVNFDEAGYCYTYKKGAQLISKDVKCMAMDDQGAVYYTDEDDVLYLYNKNKSKKVMEDVISLYSGLNSKIYASDEKGALYSIKKGKDPVKLAKDIYYMEIITKPLEVMRAAYKTTTYSW